MQHDYYSSVWIIHQVTCTLHLKDWIMNPNKLLSNVHVGLHCKVYPVQFSAEIHPPKLIGRVLLCIGLQCLSANDREAVEGYKCYHLLPLPFGKGRALGPSLLHFGCIYVTYQVSRSELKSIDLRYIEFTDICQGNKTLGSLQGSHLFPASAQKANNEYTSVQNHFSSQFSACQNPIKANRILKQLI